MRCEFCGGVDGCSPVKGRKPYHPPHYFTAEDWRDIYWFMKYIYLPFVHRIALRAEQRWQETDKPKIERRGRPRKENVDAPNS